MTNLATSPGSTAETPAASSPAASSPASSSPAPSASFLPPTDLAPGDRFPNFVLPDQGGAARSFLERAKGGRLLILGDSDDAGLQAVQQAGLAAIGFDVLALVADRPDVAKRRAEALGVGFPLLCDFAGKIRETLRRMLGLGPRGAFAVLLDPNQRITAAIAGPQGGDVIRQALDQARAVPPAEAGRYLTGNAPVLIVPNVLTPSDCRALIDRWHRLGNEEGMVTSIVKGEEQRRVHRDMKSRRDHIIMDEAVLRELVAIVGRRIGPELDKAFKFSKFRFDRFVVTCYDSERGDYFRRHRDNQTPGTTDRTFALTLNLNSEEYEGGGLTFPEYGPHSYNPPTGAAILFSCSLLHEALPITRGRRFTLLNFLRS